MAYICLKQKFIRSLSKIGSFDRNIIEIGIPIKSDEAIKVGLINVGDIVLPSASFGNISAKNANGYIYPDKTKPKERMYVSTNWIHPYGNDNASPVPADIYRKCYPKVYVPPFGIELILYADESDKRYVMVDLTPDIRMNYLKEAINLILEIYGVCYVFDGDIGIQENVKRTRRSWEFLPKGELPSVHIKHQLKKDEQREDSFSIYRLENIERYEYQEVVEGINGFQGYFAYLFEEHCVFESVQYGNATYIVRKENWEALSRKTKKELFDENQVVKKIIHSQNWEQNLSKSFRELGITRKV